MNKELNLHDVVAFVEKTEEERGEVWAYDIARHFECNGTTATHYFDLAMKQLGWEVDYPDDQAALSPNLAKIWTAPDES